MAATATPAPDGAPGTVLQMFYAEAKARLRVDYPGVPAGEIHDMARTEWKELPEAEKAQWKLKAAAARKQYQKQQRAAAREAARAAKSLQRLSRPAEEMSTQELRRTRQPNRPSEPLSASAHHAETVRTELQEEFPEANAGEINGKINAKWKSMTTTEKGPFFKLAAEGRAAYRLAMDEWAGACPEEAELEKHAWNRGKGRGKERRESDDERANGSDEPSPEPKEPKVKRSRTRRSSKTSRTKRPSTSLRCKKIRTSSRTCCRPMRRAWRT